MRLAICIQERKVEKAERRLMAVHTLHLLVPVPGPQCPQDEIGPIHRRKQREPVDAAVLTNPVPDPHMLGMRVFSESGRLRLFGGEEALLLLGDLEEPPRGFPVRLGHNTILQLS